MLGQNQNQIQPSSVGSHTWHRYCRPLHIGGWQQLLGLDAEVVARWERFQLNEEIAALTGLSVQSIKDSTAACVAELVAGRGRNVRNFIYVFVDTFIGGGLVPDSNLHIGKHGNAGAIGSDARALGGALLPICANFALDHDLFLKLDG
ncbi:ROK family protein [Iodobacter sp. LRB]|uniref:ROK family protein n=1 Tax=Iodobacter sp. LRB TaxID=3127955 RepID=UPI00307E4E59